jgi:RNA polymerase sigma-70 factor (ECF subfamily)
VAGSRSAVRAGEADDAVLVAALRCGDRKAIVELIERWSTPMLRLALVYVHDRTAAEDVVQDAWIGVLSGIHRFEGRASLKTWVFRLVANRATTRAMRERRTVPFSAVATSTAAIDADCFIPAGEAWAGHWATPPRPPTADERLLAGETRAHLTRAIRELPPAQRAVLTLRDVEGWSSTEVCDVLSLSEANQRVLLHRARTRVRRSLEPYLHEGAGGR